MLALVLVHINLHTQILIAYLHQCQRYDWGPKNLEWVYGSDHAHLGVVCHPKGNI